VYTFLIRILSTSLTSVSIFSVFYYSRYLSRWGAYQRLKTAKKRGLLYFPYSMTENAFKCCSHLILDLPQFSCSVIIQKNAKCFLKGRVSVVIFLDTYRHDCCELFFISITHNKIFVLNQIKVTLWLSLGTSHFHIVIIYFWI
jgi:hypothetical protein